MTFNQIFLIILLAILVWWPIGGFINRRRGQAWLAWLQDGVKELGASSTHKWLRSFQSVGQITVRDLRAPFESLDILFTLEGRDNLVLWLIRHLRGRRDEMIIQANLLGTPMQELEIGYRGRRSYDAYVARQKDNPFTHLPEQDGFRIAWRFQYDALTIARLRAFLNAQGQTILRMSIQRDFQVDPRIWSPREAKNILMRVDMTHMDAQSPASFFAALREWAKSLPLEVDNTIEHGAD
jgi:hypothetical protein